MSRMISFIVLLAILLAIAFLFFKVMAGFVLPLFLAVLLVVMFSPLHRWFQKKLPGRRRLAAAATTATILLIFLIPLLVVFFEATSEAVVIYHRLDKAEFNRAELVEKFNKVNARFGLELSDEKVEAEVIERVQEWLAPMVLGTTQYVIGTVIGLCIMIIALYYFLLDGPAMIATGMRLSPLDDQYESQLIDEFERTSRAVVLAAVVSAIVQGVLAGFGYYFAGLEAVFLLTMLTMLLAMVPFVGAAAVWVPCCLYLFWTEQTTAAILLGLYGGLVISMADNIIKPYILHGRSNLHPLLALLSVLGGVKVMGPIGIFIGPMAVTFLHALLLMLQKEIDILGKPTPDKVAVRAEAKT